MGGGVHGESALARLLDPDVCGCVVLHDRGTERCSVCCLVCAMHGRVKDSKRTAKMKRPLKQHSGSQGQELRRRLHLLCGM